MIQRRQENLDWWTNGITPCGQRLRQNFMCRHHLCQIGRVTALRTFPRNPQVCCRNPQHLQCSLLHYGAANSSSLTTTSLLMADCQPHHRGNRRRHGNIRRRENRPCPTRSHLHLTRNQHCQLCWFSVLHLSLLCFSQHHMWPLLISVTWSVCLSVCLSAILSLCLPVCLCGNSCEPCKNGCIDWADICDIDLGGTEGAEVLPW